MFSPAPVASWHGFYFGVHVGAGWGSNDATGTLGGGLGALLGVTPITAGTVNGFLGGGQFGYNWHTGWMVFGAEVEVSGTGIEGVSPCLAIVNCRANMDWMATFSGRLGFTVDRALVYAKGGVAWADWQYRASLAGVSSTISDSRFGWLFGLGVEYAIAPNWSAKIEYNYIDFGSDNYTFAAVGVPIIGAFNVGTSIDTQLHTIKGGVNYRFAAW